jgi:uncharacterized protein YaaN involved in tellurite resistance
VAINEQAASSTIGIDKLQAAFTNIYQTMDAIDTFKAQALNSMQTTINTLSTEIDKAQTYLARVKQADASSPETPGGDLKLPGGN